MMFALIEDPLAIYARPGLSHEEIEELKEAFDLFDTDSSGMRTIISSLATIASSLRIS
jgi:Ca2+-binding EF-hand superfamily protein